MQDERARLDKPERSRHVRTWYAGDRRRTTANEVIDGVAPAAEVLVTTAET